MTAGAGQGIDTPRRDGGSGVCGGIPCTIAVAVQVGTGAVTVEGGVGHIGRIGEVCRKAVVGRGKVGALQAQVTPAGLGAG